MSNRTGDFIFHQGSSIFQFTDFIFILSLFTTVSFSGSKNRPGPYFHGISLGPWNGVHVLYFPVRMD